MDMIVCIKQIPDPETPASAFKVDEAAKKVIPAQGTQPVVSPFDLQAAEAALRVKEQLGSGTIHVLSVGPAGAAQAIKQVLAMGADDGFLISGPGLDDPDAYATAQVIAAAAKKIGNVDAIFMGRQAADWDEGVVPMGVAELLGWPQVTVAKAVTAADGRLRVERVLQDGFETVEVITPAVVTISNELGDPRYPKLQQIMMAGRKPLAQWTAADLGLDAGQLQSRMELERLYVPVVESQVEVIEGESPAEMAANLARRLREARII